MKCTEKYWILSFINVSISFTQLLTIFQVHPFLSGHNVVVVVAVVVVVVDFYQFLAIHERVKMTLYSRFYLLFSHVIK